MDSATSSNSIAKVQQVNKKSSDELLRKFADENDAEEERKELRLAKRRKRSSSSSRRITRREGDYCESPPNNYNGSLVERKWLLPPVVTRRSAFLRQLGIGRSQIRARDVRNKSLFGTIEETWRKTIQGASKVFMEKHYNRPKRLINDVV